MKRTNAVAVSIHAVWPVSDAKLGALNSASAIIDGSRAPLTKFNTMKTPVKNSAAQFVTMSVGGRPACLKNRPGCQGFYPTTLGLFSAHKNDHSGQLIGISCATSYPQQPS